MNLKTWLLGRAKWVIKSSTMILLTVFLSSAALSVFAAEPPSSCSVHFVRGDTVVELGTFKAKVAEETETTKTYDIPQTRLKANVGVYFTDESVSIQLSPKYVQDTSIRISVSVAEKEEDRALTSLNASVGEAALVSQTSEQNLLRVIKFIRIGKEQAAVIAECKEK